MPERLHRELEQQADKKGLHGARKDAYVYGTLNRVEQKSHKPVMSEHRTHDMSRPGSYPLCKTCGKPIGRAPGGEWKHFK